MKRKGEERLKAMGMEAERNREVLKGKKKGGVR